MSPTHSHAGKVRTDLMDFSTIRSAVSDLQKGYKQQISIEKESQATFEYLHNQVIYDESN